jgi:hypothetical protein
LVLVRVRRCCHRTLPWQGVPSRCCKAAV